MSNTIVILRFRDLVVPTPGHTIREHTELINQFGYTWWGWWKKQAEKVPEATWSILIREVNASRVGDLYLLDSGQRKLYKAELLDVSYAPGKDEAPVPENGEKTPKYYGESKDGSQIRFASWFKIRNITEVAEAALHELAFAVLPHDDFAQVAPKEIVDRRIDKVANLLRFGNVTYWVGKLATVWSVSVS